MVATIPCSRAEGGLQRAIHGVGIVASIAATVWLVFASVASDADPWPWRRRRRSPSDR